MIARDEAAISGGEMMTTGEIAQPSKAPKPVEFYKDRHLTVGDIGSLAEQLGTDGAEQFYVEHSLTRTLRIRAAQRLGRLSS